MRLSPSNPKKNKNKKSCAKGTAMTLWTREFFEPIPYENP